MTRIAFGESELEYPSDDFLPLRRSDDIADDTQALKERLAEDGYLYLPGYLDRDDVLAARQHILEYMDEQEGLEPGSRPLDGVMGEYGRGVPLMGKSPITHCDEVSRVLESPRLFELYQRLHGEPIVTFDYKWLRAVGNAACTGVHMDHVYMGRGSDRLMTAWVPFDDLPLEMGVLTVIPGTNRLPEFERLRNTYGRMDVDKDGIADGWFSKCPTEVTQNIGGTWHASPIRAGDVITFGMHLMHASTTNVTNKWRISCDVRFQPAGDPMDDRWIGKEPKGHDGRDYADVPARSMQEARAAWGV